MGKRSKKSSKKRNPALKNLEIKQHESTKIKTDQKISVKGLDLGEVKKIDIESKLNQKQIHIHAKERWMELQNKFSWKDINFGKIEFDKLKQNKKFIGSVAAIMFVCLVAGGFAKSAYDKKVAHEEYTRAVDVVVDGQSLGIARKQEDVESLIENIEDDISKEYGVEISSDQNIELVATHAEDNELTSNLKLEKQIRENLDVKVEAFGILVNGESLGYLKSEKLAMDLVEDIEKPYIEKLRDDGVSIKKVETLESVVFVNEKVKISDISEYDELLSYLQKGTTEEKTHIVESGDSYWAIANKYNISVDNLIKANPDRNPEVIQIGDEISLVVPKPYISVVTYEEATATEKMPYEVEYTETSSLYSDEQRVKVKGIYGEREILANVKKVNGIVSDREIVSETIIREPKTQLIAKGTKKVPSTRGKGTFIMPVNGKLTSRYGYRNLGGRRNFHSGVDLAIRQGTPVKAADGGVVTFAGWKGSYGYLVEIDHGGGFKTRYAHNSKIYVKVGEKVYQGKTISAVGNTGRSTGPHVHFEVLKYGKTQNPYTYLNKKYR